MSELVQLNRIRADLAKAKDIKSVLAIRDKAEAIRTYAKVANLGRDIQNDAAYVKIEAERRAGELLKGMAERKERETHGGNRKSKSHNAIMKLDDLGIKPDQSSRWQRMASVPEKALNQYVAEAKIDGEVTSAGVLRIERKIRREAVTPNKTPPLPKGKFRTIVIDPPWPMQKIDRDDRPNQAEFAYPTMPVDEISALNIKSFADTKSHLYLWTTQKFLPQAFGLLAGWGFDYLVTMVWHKAGGFQPPNLPQFNCEFVLLGRRGGLPFLSCKAFSTCFSGKRREHSRKPEEFYDLIQRVSPGPRLDMFSREKHNGFDSWGAEKGKLSK